ncbi:hypothetical protein AVEN_90896-1 [Araneus ventricosus]|uniref:Uncharacterized protein n=1 Tax=Araneus ventricosus TaxID=182803 RepID=A0A4Y2NJM3_ARAVE|nr:hypothetical protein AVEN_90896-1 [Araneus ventricosus]
MQTREKEKKDKMIQKKKQHNENEGYRLHMLQSYTTESSQQHEARNEASRVCWWLLQMSHFACTEEDDGWRNSLPLYKDMG